MPLSIDTTAGNNSYGNPFVGPVDHTAQIKVDVSTLLIDGTGKQVDTKGYLKPGVPLNKTGDAIGSGDFVFGVVVEATKIVPETPSNASLAAVTADPPVTVATIAQVNRDIIEDNLGRALTADEIAGFNLAGSKIVLLPT